MKIFITILFLVIRLSSSENKDLNMWASLLPIVLPAVISLVTFFYQEKLLSDAQMTAFLNYVQAMANEPNNSEAARQAFCQMHAQLEALHDQLKTPPAK